MKKTTKDTAQIKSAVAVDPKRCIQGLPVRPGMVVFDTDGPGPASTVVAVGRNGVAVLNKENDEVAFIEWSDIAILAQPAYPETHQMTTPHIDQRWWALKDLFAGDPMIAPNLRAIEKFCKDVPPLLWFAVALNWLASSTHDHDNVQSKWLT